MDYTTFRFSRPATRQQIYERETYTRELLVRDEPVVRHAASPESEDLTAEVLTYMRVIREHPGIPVTVRDERAGFSRKKGAWLRKTLTEMGFLTSKDVNPAGKRGRNFRDYELTPEGASVLRAAENRRE